MSYDELGTSRQFAPGDIDPARQNDKSTWRDFAGRGDPIAACIGFKLAEPPQPTDLRRLQHGKHLIAAGFAERMSRLRHDSLTGRLAFSGYGRSGANP